MAVNKIKTNNSNELAGNIDLGYSTKKKRFSVGGDVNNVVELDTSDLGVANRLSRSMKDFKDIENKWNALNESADTIINTDDLDAAMTSTEDFSNQFEELEKQVRKIIDEVFDSDVADKCLGNSSAFSPVNGYFKYEHIITALLNCYEQQIKDEAPKFNARKINKYTNKYIKR